MNLLDHYKKLWFYNFNRYKSDNYQLMREYFAKVLISDAEKHLLLSNKRVLDVGGARGEFCSVLSKERDCDAINLDPVAGKDIWQKSIRGYADSIPFSDNEFDLVICRGVLEHIRPEKQQNSINDMFRVTKRGGFCYIMIPPWYNPHAGHSFRPFHILGFATAKRLKKIFYNWETEADSFAQMNIFPITFNRILKMIKVSGFKVVETTDVHFRIHLLTKIPVIREVAVASAGFMLQKSKDQ